MEKIFYSSCQFLIAAAFFQLNGFSVFKEGNVTTSTLYLDHFQLSRPPFDQEPQPGLFFPAAGRESVLQNLLADVESGKQLVKLTGSEGTGKTLLCRILEESLDPARYHHVCLEYPVGSYENLLRTICFTLGTVEEENDAEDMAPPDYVDLFRQYLQQFEAQGRNLVLLIDEAENLFLATLERLLRLICNPDIHNLQILLIGRPELESHLDQLAIYCSSVDLTTGYKLEALTLEETKRYIHFRLQYGGITGDKYLVVFSDDALEAIFQTAMGNISLTNSLAEQGMKRAAEEGKFQVDDELVLPQQTIEENVSLAVFQGFDFVRDNKWWLILGTVLVWIVLMLLWPSSDQQVPQPGQSVAPEEQLELITPAQKIDIPPPVPDLPEIVDRQEVVLSVEPEIKAPESKEPEMDAVEEPRQLTSKREMRITEEPQSVIEVQPLEEVKSVQERKEIVIEPEKRKKIVLEQPLPEEQQEVLPLPAPPPEPEPESEEVSLSSEVGAPGRDADALYDERLQATASWLSRAYQGGYTIQLMVLASDNAEENLKKILVDDRYYTFKNQLYILQKRTPKTLYVFFGHYPSMDKARRSRNNMPKFLRDNQPYVLSIKDALEKSSE